MGVHLYPQKDADGPRGQVVGGWSWAFFNDDPGKLALGVSLVNKLYTSTEGIAGWRRRSPITLP